MFSLDDTARTHEIDEVSLAQLQKLTNSIAQVFTAPSIETLERQLGLSPIASGSTSNAQDANFPVTRGNKLSFAQRRDNVIDALFDQSSFSQRRIAISILDNADRATQAKYSQKVKKYVREAIKKNIPIGMLSLMKNFPLIHLWNMRKSLNISIWIFLIR